MRCEKYRNTPCQEVGEEKPSSDNRLSHKLFFRFGNFSRVFCLVSIITKLCIGLSGLVLAQKKRKAFCEIEKEPQQSLREPQDRKRASSSRVRVKRWIYDRTAASCIRRHAALVAHQLNFFSPKRSCHGSSLQSLGGVQVSKVKQKKKRCGQYNVALGWRGPLFPFADNTITAVA